MLAGTLDGALEAAHARDDVAEVFVIGGGKWSHGT